MSRTRTVAVWGVVLSFLAIGLAVFPLQVMGWRLRSVPGGFVDGRFTNYILEHGYRVLRGQEVGFWDPPFFYPLSNAKALADSHIGTLPIYAFFRLTGFDRETAYQLWWVAGFVLNYVCCYAVLRRFFVSVLGAVAGAFLFAFALPLRAQLDHLQLFPRLAVPIAFYCAWRFLQTGAFRYGLGVGLAIVWQAYATIYMAWFLVVVLAGFILGYGWMQWRDGTLRWTLLCGSSLRAFAGRLASAVLCAGALLPLLAPHRKVVFPGLMEENLSELLTMLPRMQSWFLPSTGALLWSKLEGFERTLVRGHEHHMFLGLAAVIALLFGIGVAWRGGGEQKRIAAAAVTAIAFPVLVTLSVDGYSVYLLLAHLPGVLSVRAVTRICLVVAFPAALLVGLLGTRIQSWLQRRGFRRLAPAVALAFLTFVVLDQQAVRGEAHASKENVQRRARAIAAAVARADRPAKSFVVIPRNVNANVVWLPQGPLAKQLDAMMASQDLGIPTLNGYSGHLPVGWTVFHDWVHVEDWEAAWRSGTPPWFNSPTPRYRRDGFDDLAIIGPIGGRPSSASDPSRVLLVDKVAK